MTLPYRLIAEGRGNAVEALVTGGHVDPIGAFFLLVPLALAGRETDIDRMARGLEQLARRKLKVKRFLLGRSARHGKESIHGKVLDAVLTACEILTSRRAASELVDRLLADFLDPELRRIDRHHAHEPLKLDLLFRAYSLKEARAGRIPDAAAVFEPRPAPSKERNRHQSYEIKERHDRPLKELAGVVFEIYATVANVLVNRREDAELEEELRRASGRLEAENWRISREQHGGALRRYAATGLLVLLAVGHAPRMLNRFATDVHGRWRNGSAVPDERFVARLSLWPSLHGSLQEDLSVAAAEARNMRIGAEEKSDTLVRYARLMKPVSKPDANEIFNTAVEVASELDHEVIAQIRLLDQLVSRGGGRFTDARDTARKLGNIVADAAIRLDAHDHFPWERAMAALARLDAPLALSNLARWDDEGIASLRETLTPALKTAVGERTIAPAQAAALTTLSDDRGDVIAEVLDHIGHAEYPSFPALVEDAACDVLIRDAHRARGRAVHCIKQQVVTGPWSDSLLRQGQFMASLLGEPITDGQRIGEPDTEADGPPIAHEWSRENLVDGALLQEAVQDAWDRMRAERTFHRRSAIFEAARLAVLPADRTAHLAALADLDGPAIAGGAVEAMLQAIEEWRASPSVQAWCRTELPKVIVTRLPALTYYPMFDEDNLTPALKRTGLADSKIQELLLTGLERHVDELGSERIFSLAGLIGRKLARGDAARAC